jgi:glutamate-5-semialdehyde dehydrogenase
MKVMVILNSPESIQQSAKRAALAARQLALAVTGVKNQALAALEAALQKNSAAILQANEQDVREAMAQGLSPHLIDRLSLNLARLGELAAAVANVRQLPDPVGAVEDAKILASGLDVRRLRIPLGLIAFICEARPGALVEAASLTIKSGNGLIVKCGKEMGHTAACLQTCFNEAFAAAGLAPEAVTVLTTANRDDLKEMLTLSETIDLVIPRGGEGLIRFVSENSRIPVLKHFKGVCHLYVDEAADLDMALNLAVNGKTQRPSTCNSLEALLVHEAVAADFLPELAKALAEKNVTIKADQAAAKFLPDAEMAADEDWGREFLDLVIAVKVVPGYQAALDHIALYGSNHTEVIVTGDTARGEHFQRAVEAACVMVNASSRLNDGGCLGLGAEIGISTTRLHAYGPMGLRDLTTTRFIVTGDGHQR